MYYVRARVHELLVRVVRKLSSYFRMRSASRQARKIHGDIVPGDQTHADIALQYKNHFKEEHRNLPKSLSTCKIPKYKVWEMCSTIMLVSNY